MNPKTTRWLGVLCSLAGLLACSGANAEDWIKYYEVGTGHSRADYRPVENYYIDASSIRREGNLLRYRTKKLDIEEDRTLFFEMVVDCVAKTRGQLPSHELYDTYKDTMGGEELKAVCDLGNQPGS